MKWATICYCGYWFSVYFSGSSVSLTIRCLFRISIILIIMIYSPFLTQMGIKWMKLLVFISIVIILTVKFEDNDHDSWFVQCYLARLTIVSTIVYDLSRIFWPIIGWKWCNPTNNDSFDITEITKNLSIKYKMRYSSFQFAILFGLQY